MTEDAGHEADEEVGIGRVDACETLAFGKRDLRRRKKGRQSRPARLVPSQSVIYGAPKAGLSRGPQGAGRAPSFEKHRGEPLRR